MGFSDVCLEDDPPRLPGSPRHLEKSASACDPGPFRGQRRPTVPPYWDGDDLGRFLPLGLDPEEQSHRRHQPMDHMDAVHTTR